ncbi:MAG: group II intron reverse transcriptase/maturase [Bacteroides sp.]|nr:group II intron reverse transcriptase/maturase [Bacteroides sp.]
MGKAEYIGNNGCPQRDSTECKEYAGAHSVVPPDNEEMDGRKPNLLEQILNRDNLNRAYKRVKANKGAPGVDGMTVEEALPWLKEHGKELTDSILQGKYKPDPVRRKEIPKPDGGVRKLGIPSVKDRIVQQGVAQILTPIYEPLFSDGSYGYRPGRSAQDAIRRILEYGKQGYEWAVLLDLSKYFDTLNHEKLLIFLRREISDERVIQLIKRFLKSGVMENGVVMPTEEGSPQGGPLSPLLANIYLNEFDQEYGGRGVPVIRYADDIVILCKSERAAGRLLESNIRYLEDKLKLKVNRDKSHIAKLNAIKNFKYLGFAFGKGKDGLFIRVHKKALNKAKEKLRELTKRNQGRNVKVVMGKTKEYLRGWLNYYGIAEMKTTMKEWDGWLRRRLRMYIWKQWKKPKTKYRELRKRGIPETYAWMAAMSRRGYWFMAQVSTVERAISNERLVSAGYYNILKAYESIHSAMC